MTAQDVDRLARAYCDRCPLRAACYRSAIGDPRATGVYGGAYFRRGRPRQHNVVSGVRAGRID